MDPVTGTLRIGAAFAAAVVLLGPGPATRPAAAQASAAAPVAEFGVKPLNNRNVHVYWSGAGENVKDWISVVRPGTPDNSFPEDKQYWRYCGWSSGEVAFGPLKPGAWEARFYLRDGYEVARRVSFTID